MRPVGFWRAAAAGLVTAFVVSFAAGGAGAAPATYTPQTRDITVSTAPQVIHEMQGPVQPGLKDVFGDKGVLSGDHEVYRFNPDAIFVYQGDTVNLTVVNPQPDDPHTFTLSGYGVNVSLNPNSSGKTSFKADKVGVFTYACLVPGHMPYMWGTLVVLPDPGSADASTGASSSYAAQHRSLTESTVPLVIHEQQDKVQPGLKDVFGDKGVLSGDHEVYGFNPNTLVVYQGDTVDLTVVNPQPDDPHTFTLPDLGVNLSLNPNSSGKVSFVAGKEGIYKFACLVPGHMPYMWGTLVVLPAPGSPDYNALGAIAHTAQKLDTVVSTVPLVIHEQQDNVQPGLKDVFGDKGVLSGDHEVYGFNPDTLVVTQGDTVNLTVVNPQPDDPHTFTLADLGVNLSLNPNSSGKTTFVASKAGIYTYACLVPGHVPYMWGTLVVLPTGLSAAAAAPAPTSGSLPKTGSPIAPEALGLVLLAAGLLVWRLRRPARG